jgi:hypothetical protein
MNTFSQMIKQKATPVRECIVFVAGHRYPELAENAAAELERLSKIEVAAVNLFQACADLPLPEMNRMGAVINAMSEALK